MNIYNKKPLYNPLNKVADGSIIINKNVFLFYKNNVFFDMYNKYFEKLTDFKNINKYYNGTTNNKVLYLLKNNQNNKIFIADIFFKEFDYININLKKNEKITDITYNLNNNSIILATNFNIFSITKKGKFIKNIINNNTKNILGLNNILYKKNIDGNIEKFNTASHNITAILHYDNILYIAFNINDSSYICLVDKEGKIINKIFIEKNIIIKSIFHSGFDIKILITKLNLYNYIYYLK